LILNHEGAGVVDGMGRGVQGLPSVGCGWFLLGVCAQFGESDSEAMPMFPKLTAFPYVISFFRLRFFGELGLTDIKMHNLIR